MRTGTIVAVLGLLAQSTMGWIFLGRFEDRTYWLSPYDTESGGIQRCAQYNEKLAAVDTAGLLNFIAVKSYYGGEAAPVYIGSWQTNDYGPACIAVTPNPYYGTISVPINACDGPLRSVCQSEVLPPGQFKMLNFDGREDDESESPPFNPGTEEIADETSGGTNETDAFIIEDGEEAFNMTEVLDEITPVDNNETDVSA